jgi:hypothetical protein
MRGLALPEESASPASSKDKRQTLLFGAFDIPTYSPFDICSSNIYRTGRSA